MNRSELVYEISKRTATTPNDVNGVLDALGDLMRECAADGSKLQIAGLLTLERVERAARTGRNPRTGEQVAVDAKKVPYFKPGKEMRERLNV